MLQFHPMTSYKLAYRSEICSLSKYSLVAPQIMEKWHIWRTTNRWTSDIKYGNLSFKMLMFFLCVYCSLRLNQSTVQNNFVYFKIKILSENKWIEVMKYDLFTAQICKCTWFFVNKCITKLLSPSHLQHIIGVLIIISTVPLSYSFWIFTSSF